MTLPQIPKTYQIPVTAEHIHRARFFRQVSVRTTYVPRSCTCPIALALRGVFGHYAQIGWTTAGILNEDGQYLYVFSHNGFEQVCEFDNVGTVDPFILTLTLVC